MKLKTWHKIALGLILLVAILRIFARPAADRPYYEGANFPLVIAHQGGDGLWPGDTMFAFENAVKIGTDVLEMDAHITKDSQIVLMHDEKVDRTTNGTGLIEDLTLSELKELDAAYRWTNNEYFHYHKTVHPRIACQEYQSRAMDGERPRFDETIHRLGCGWHHHGSAGSDA